MRHLQQQMKKIEEERLRVRVEIENLNEKLETLTRPGRSFQEQVEVSHSSAEEPLANLKNKNKTGDITAAPLSQLPRFMRPTFCSRRKSGMNLHTSEGKEEAIGRRRRSSSHRAESVTFPVKNNSEYNSDRSISRSSCLAGLNMKNSADYETEYSQETLDSDLNIAAFPEHDTSQRTSVHPRDPLSYLEKCGSQKTEKFHTKKFSKVDDWLLHKNEPTVTGITHRSNRVLAIPVPGKKHGGRGPSTAETLGNGNVPAYDYTEENTVSHNKTKKQLDVKGVEVPISEVITEKPQKMLKDLFEMDSREDLISSSHVIEGQTMMEMQDFGDSLSIDDTTSTSSLADIYCGRLNQYKDDDEMYTISIMQPVKGEICCPDSTIKHGGYTYPSESEDSIIESKGDSGVSFSISELESRCRQIYTEIDIKDKEKKELQASSRLSPCPLKLRSQRAQMNQKDLNVPYIISPGSTQSEGEKCS